MEIKLHNFPEKHFSWTTQSYHLLSVQRREDSEKLLTYQLIIKLCEVIFVDELDFDFSSTVFRKELCFEHSSRLQVCGWNLPKPHGSTREIFHKLGRPAAGKFGFLLSRVLMNLLHFKPVFSWKFLRFPRSKWSFGLHPSGLDRETILQDFSTDSFEERVVLVCGNCQSVFRRSSHNRYQGRIEACLYLF